MTRFTLGYLAGLLTTGLALSVVGWRRHRAMSRRHPGYPNPVMAGKHYLVGERGVELNIRSLMLDTGQN